ncbi:MAG TPA: outer membrane protein transport protein [Kofleriaceae bacterium]
MRTLIITATILAPAAASAGGYLIPSSDPRALAVAQSSVADEGGASALSLNTAALAGQEGLDIAAAGEMLNNRTEWSDPTLGTASLSEVSTPPALAISYGAKLPGDKAWGVGVGLGAPAGGLLKWPMGWAGQESIQSVNQQVVAFQAGAAFQLLPFVKIGASYIRFQATEELHQSLNFLDHFGDAGLAMSGGGDSFGVATEVRVPNMPLSFGINYTHASDIGLSGHAHFTNVPPAFQTMLHDQDVTETLLIPDVVFAGAAYEVMPNLKVMAAYSFEHWSDYKADVFKGSDGFTATVTRNYNNSQVLRLGGEWKKLPFLPQLTLRAGILRSISDQPAETLSPSLTDASVWAPSIGAGFNILPNLRVDVGYEHAFFDTVTATGADALPGTYKTNVDLVSLGVNWRMDPGMAKAPAK